MSEETKEPKSKRVGWGTGGLGGEPGPLAVIAFGGNALLEPDDEGTVEEQLRRAEAAAAWLSELVGRGWRLVIVHGNGPQVGQAMIQMEAAVDKVPPGTLDLAVAETQGSMGYLLDLALRNRFADRKMRAQPACLLSVVVVDVDDPGFDEPTKPVGPHFSEESATMFRKKYGWLMREDRSGPSGKAWRKVVPSPRPLEILGIDSVRDLLECNRVVVAGGGGGIPVVRENGATGKIRGVEAVIDKDRTASLLARELSADLFLILTNVDRVKKDFGTDREEALPVLPLAEARRLLGDGQFPAGSMGPKVEAAIDFVAASGRKVIITDIGHVHDAIDGDAGTAIVPD